ncbi:hypothetical protein BJ875DRAFT_156257 [Amylocarpus encephaloides]|uniref:Mid2 domain-containing protein n=1 Tax=Amylocarpus encephaloides TaxID=45428 RepID=A0A9P7YQ76_9HELO|nr:hypothetical protein BJ875DRAFT_156257 [Amylocarpus encephaloides]
MAFNLFAMPSSSIALLFSLLLGLTDAMPWAEPIQTVAYKTDEWSPRPTVVPEDPAKLFKRAAVGIEVCGWLGGNLAYPAACGTGSSCIHDTIHGYVGCCTTDGLCDQGIYTTCLDIKSPGWASTANLINNGVTTCGGSAQCYKNTYPGQYYQYSCGDPTAATTISTAYVGQPPEVRLQVVFTGVTFDSQAVTANGKSFNVATATGSLASETGASAGKVSAAGAASSAAAPTGSTTSPGTVAGGTIAGVAGVALLAGFLFWFLRRRANKQNKSRRSGSAFFERKDPFSHEPIQQNYNPDEYVSPMTGHPDNARGFAGDTSYHGGEGMGRSTSPVNSHRPLPPFSAAVGGNPFSDEVPPPPPTTVHPLSSSYTDVARTNPFSDRHTYEVAPKPLHERHHVPGRNTPSPTQFDHPQEQTMPLVNEIDHFSHSWSQSGIGRGRRLSFDNSDNESDSSRPRLRTATSVAIMPQGRVVDRDVSTEALRSTPHSEGWLPPRLRPAKSDISSLHNQPTHHRDQSGSRHITAPVPGYHHQAKTSNSSVSSYQGTPTPGMQAAQQNRPPHPLEQETSYLIRPVHPLEQEASRLIRPVHPLEQESQQLIRPPHPLEQQQTLLHLSHTSEPLDPDMFSPSNLGRGRLDSDESSYSDNTAYHRSSFTSLKPLPPAKSPKRMSFGLNGAISEVVSGDNWRASDGWSPAWSGIGGGWLEGQSGMAMSTVLEDKESEIHELDSKMKAAELESNASGAGLKREGGSGSSRGSARGEGSGSAFQSRKKGSPNSKGTERGARSRPFSGVPILNSPSLLQEERGRKGTFGVE